MARTEDNKRIIETLLRDIPSEDDPRQTIGKRVIGAFKTKHEQRGSRVTTPNWTGMPASKVDLGLVSDRITEAWALGLCEVVELKEFVEIAIPLMVQRIKRLRVKTSYGSLGGSGPYTDFSIRLQTKDDYTYYEYSWNVRLWQSKKLKTKEEGSPSVAV